jgi:stage III sporulation protein AG
MKIRELFEKINKTKDSKIVLYLGAALAVGALIMLFGRWPPNPMPTTVETAPVVLSNEKTTAAPTAAFPAERALEKRLEEAFSLIEGAGQVRVLVSLLPEKETVFAKDTNTSDSYTRETDAQGGSREQRSRTNQEKLITITNAGETLPLVLREIEPGIAGVVIIAEGGDNVFVKDALTRAACTVLDIKANKVQVLKMEPVKKD